MPSVRLKCNPILKLFKLIELNYFYFYSSLYVSFLYLLWISYFSIIEELWIFLPLIKTDILLILSNLMSYIIPWSLGSEYPKSSALIINL